MQGDNEVRIFRIVFIAVFVLSGVVFSILYLQHFAEIVDSAIDPCQHRTVSGIGGRCNCSNTIFNGSRCENPMCGDHGTLAFDTSQTDIRVAARYPSDWSCRCDNKWSGYLCDVCNTKDTTSGECKGECKEFYSGLHCENTCYPNLNKNNRYSAETLSGTACKSAVVHGGACNYCSGYGTCNRQGVCKCDTGYFDSAVSKTEVAGCSVSCPSHKGRFCSGSEYGVPHGVCHSPRNLESMPYCVCKKGFGGNACEKKCKNECSGFGSCVEDVDGNFACECPNPMRGEWCQHTCNGVSVCSGMGEASVGAKDGCNATGHCTCKGNWQGDACNCHTTETCNKRGTCNDDGKCTCETYFDPPTCAKCELNRYPVGNCKVYCLASENCTNHGTCTADGTCDCNYGWEGDQCDTCALDMYPDSDHIGFRTTPLTTVLTEDVYYCQIEITDATCYNNGDANHYFGDGTPRGEYRCSCRGNYNYKTQCSTCSESYYNATCDKFCSADPPSGRCVNGRCDADGDCVCDTGFFGVNCDSTCGGAVSYTHQTLPTNREV